jgi:hypothetical protein
VACALFAFRRVAFLFAVRAGGQQVEQIFLNDYMQTTDNMQTTNQSADAQSTGAQSVALVAAGGLERRLSDVSSADDPVDEPIDFDDIAEDVHIDMFFLDTGRVNASHANARVSASHYGPWTRTATRALKPLFLRAALNAAPPPSCNQARRCARARSAR